MESGSSLSSASTAWRKHSHDAEAWKTYTVTEARRIKAFLDLPERAGLEGLAKVLKYRFYANINRDEILLEGNTLTYRTMECRVQTARARKQMDYHPCKPVGLIEYAGFAKVIDNRIACECLSCYPDVRDPSCCCSWRLTLVGFKIGTVSTMKGSNQNKGRQICRPLF